MTYHAKWGFQVVLLTTLVIVALHDSILTLVLTFGVALAFKMARKYDLVNRVLSQLPLAKPASYYYTPPVHNPDKLQPVVEETPIAVTCSAYEDVENQEGMLLVIPSQ